MPEDKVWYLKQINLFEGMDESEMMDLASKAFEKSCNKKEVLYTPFNSTNLIYILKQGEVTLFHSKDGKKIIIDILKPGSIFGNISFEPQNNTHFAEVTEDAFICTLNLDDFLGIIQSKPELLNKFMNILLDRLSEYEMRIKLNLLSSKERVLEAIEALEDKNAHSFLNALRGKKRKITHEKIAEYTGLTRETVSRSLSELKKDGKISSDEAGNFIINM